MTAISPAYAIARNVTATAEMTIAATGEPSGTYAKIARL
jgi:hypothetical protein